MFADLISQQRSPAEAKRSWATETRAALRKQPLEKRYHRTTPVLHTDMTRDDFGIFAETNANSKSEEEDTDQTDRQTANKD